MKQVITAPEKWERSRGGATIFLAGGITDCPDWQSYAIELLDDEWIIFNPRRSNWVIERDTAEEQIKWEFKNLERVNVILFWFPESRSPQPIALYEFGRHLALKSHLYVGCDPHYSRAQDVIIQYELARPNSDIYVHDSLESLVAEVNDLV